MATAFGAPLTFVPLYKERVWGGRLLEERWGKELPEGVPIGESWEVVDREDDQSVVACGPLAGTSLQALWREHREAVFGRRARELGERFPLLVKLLDARETISVQVHPPAEIASALGGEPKSELWFFADAAPGAHVFAGLRAGVTREDFGAALGRGQDASAMLHRLDVSAGDAMPIPSGRVHAIGGGCLVVEVQQSSDTTYRVFDFNRPGLDGTPRELHVAESMASIDFEDAEPALCARDAGTLAAGEFFAVRRVRLDGRGEPLRAAPGETAIVCVLDGEVTCAAQRFAPGSLFLVPAVSSGRLPVLPGGTSADVLVIELPGAR